MTVPRLPGLGSLPPEDRERSPRTGWTRAHWERIADLLLAGVLPYASPRLAFIRIPGPVPSDDRRIAGLEGYARTFLLAAFRLAGSRGDAPGDLAERYALGLVAGTDMTGDEAWPPIEDVSQPIVEAALVALSLYETRPWIWDRLSEAERARAVAWLAGIHGRRVWNNNWRLFPVIVNAFLKSVGAPHRQDEIERGLDLVDSWYHSDGWYSDGAGANYDHYGGWALHFYTLLWCRMDGDRSDTSRAAEYRRRSRAFLQQYARLFGANGAPLYHGRSLTYRFAAAAPLWAGALVGATALPAGETRRIASGVLRYFLERGAVRNGLLTPGWHGPFPAMLQHYSGHGSPYWASKGFLGLLLAPDDPVWSTVEEPMPVEREDFQIAMRAPGFLAVGTRADGVVRVASHRSDHYPLPGPPMGRARCAATRLVEVVRRRSLRPSLGPGDVHYRKLAYSTHAAPEVGPPGDAADFDSTVAVLRAAEAGSRRVRIHPIAVVDRFAASVFYPREPDWGERVETVSIAIGRIEIRIHHVMSPRPYRVRDGGFSIAGEEEASAALGEIWALTRHSSGLASFVGALHGFHAGGVQHLEGTNPFGPLSATPYLISDRLTEPESVHVSLVVLTGEPLDPVAALAMAGRVEVRGRWVTIVRPDGESLFVQLVEPEDVDTVIGGARIRGPVRLARVAPDGSAFSYPTGGE